MNSFDVKVAKSVAEETGLPFVTAENKFEALVMHFMGKCGFSCEQSALYVFTAHYLVSGNP